MNYYIQTTMGPKGNYKIHKVGCKQMPMTSNRFYLGNLFNAIHAISSFIICLPIYLAIGVYALRDDTCGGTDKVSLEKRCQKAIEHYKGRQVNF